MPTIASPLAGPGIASTVKTGARSWPARSTIVPYSVSGSVARPVDGVVRFAVDEDVSMGVLEMQVAVVRQRDGLDDPLTCFRCATLADRNQVRSSNAIDASERSGGNRPMGTFRDRTSMDRILFAVFTHQDSWQGNRYPFPPTSNS
ncbi:MAG: hypothetical protein OXI57_00865 [Rhodospirillales bacterium]|nr:hypothetical protein [Rhodospirillales bacterium]